MRFRLLSRRTCIGLAALAFCAGMACSAQVGGRERGRKIEFSVPKSDEVTTNLHQLTSKKDSLKQLEEDLYKPLETFAPKSSMDGVAVRPSRPPARSAIENKRVKDLLDRRKNWVFMNPDELVDVPTIEEVLKAPQFGPEKESSDLAPVQSFYQRLSAKRSGKDPTMPLRNEDLLGTTKAKGAEDRSAPEESSLPGGVKERADTLKRLFGATGSDDPSSRLSTRGTLEDTFGLAIREPSDDEAKAHKKFLTDYRSVADPTWSPPTPAGPENPFGALSPTAPIPAAKPVVNLPTVAITPSRNAMDLQADVLAPRLGPTLLPDVNAQALGQPRSSDIFPKLETSRVVAPAPTFEVPKRSFR